MRFEKIRHGGVGALRCGRFREHCGESVGERFRLVHVEKLGLQTVFLQCRGKVAAVMAEEVTARRHEEAGRERGDHRRIFGVDVFPERRMPPTAAIDYVRGKMPMLSKRVVYSISMTYQELVETD